MPTDTTLTVQCRTQAEAEPVRAYLINTPRPSGLYLVFAADPVCAALKLAAVIGDPIDESRPDEDYGLGYSISGSYDAVDGGIIHVNKWWPHFTNNPDGPTAIQIVRNMK